MENIERITVASRRLRRICTGLVFFVPMVCILYWVLFNHIRHLPGMAHFPVVVSGDLSALTRMLACFTDLIPISALIYGLLKLERLFRLYESGLIFTEKNVACFRSLGRTMIAWVICHVVRTSLISTVLTLHNPPGQRMITLGLDGSDLGGLFVGGIILTITWVMDEGRKIREDQELYI